MQSSLTPGPNQLLLGWFCQPCLSSHVARGAEQAWLSCYLPVYPVGQGTRISKHLLRTAVGEEGRAA